MNEQSNYTEYKMNNNAAPQKALYWIGVSDDKVQFMIGSGADVLHMNALALGDLIEQLQVFHKLLANRNDSNT